MKHRLRLFHLRVASLLLTLVLTTIAFGCSGSREEKGRQVTMVVTAYCSCGECCGWRRTFWGVPVFNYGPQEGRRKAVGICADGTRARRGVVAADTAHYPLGTRMKIPGYGHATVRDRGGAIKGPARLDVFFPRHEEALQWGRQEIVVTVYDR